MSGRDLATDDFWEAEKFIDPEGFAVWLHPCPMCRALVLERHIRGHIDWHEETAV